MTEQEKINSEVQMKLAMQDAKFNVFMSEMRDRDNQRAAEIAVETVKNYPRHSLKTIVFNVFLDKDYDIYQNLL